VVFPDPFSPTSAILSERISSVTCRGEPRGQRRRPSSWRTADNGTRRDRFERWMAAESSRTLSAYRSRRAENSPSLEEEADS